jgi:hypothetical protein
VLSGGRRRRSPTQVSVALLPGVRCCFACGRPPRHTPVPEPCCDPAPRLGCPASQQGRIADAGAIPLLVELLRSPKDATRKAAASGGRCGAVVGGSALRSVACDSHRREGCTSSPCLACTCILASVRLRFKKAKATKGCVHAHIDYQLLNTAPCTTRAPLHPPESRYRPCTAALWNLAYRHNPNRKAIVHAGAIPLLVRLLAVRLLCIHTALLLSSSFAVLQLPTLPTWLADPPPHPPTPPPPPPLACLPVWSLPVNAVRCLLPPLLCSPAAARARARRPPAPCPTSPATTTSARGTRWWRRGRCPCWWP